MSKTRQNYQNQPFQGTENWPKAHNKLRSYCDFIKLKRVPGSI